MTLHLSAEELAARAAAQRKAWKLNHPDRMREFYRKHASKPEVKLRKLQWAQDNKETINAQRRAKYRLDHPLPIVESTETANITEEGIQAES